MAILEKEVLVTLNNNTINYYKSLGYFIPTYINNYGHVKIKRNTTIFVKIEDLPKGSHAQVTKICDDCGEVSAQTYRGVLKLRKKNDNKDRCLTCGQKFRDKLRKEAIIENKSLEYYAKNENKIYLLDEFSPKNKKTPREISYGTHDKFLWDCFNCGSEYFAKVNNRTSSNTGCPHCNESKGEKRIQRWLDKNDIEYVKQKRFEGLLGVRNGLLSFDFYIPKHNSLIEFQGEFHDGSSRGYAKNNLAYQKEHDNAEEADGQADSVRLAIAYRHDGPGQQACENADDKGEDHRDPQNRRWPPPCHGGPGPAPRKRIRLCPRRRRSTR